MTYVKSPFKRAGRSDSGAALAELAALSTILALLLLGCIDFGYYFYDGILLGNAAQAGVQFGAHNVVTAYDYAGMRAAATSDVNGKITMNTPTPSTFCTCSDGTSAGTVIACTTTTCSAGNHRLQFVQVISTGTYAPLNTYPGIPATISLSRTAVMQVSQ